MVGAVHRTARAIGSIAPTSKKQNGVLSRPSDAHGAALPSLVNNCLGGLALLSIMRCRFAQKLSVTCERKGAETRSIVTRLAVADRDGRLGAACHHFVSILTILTDIRLLFQDFSVGAGT